LERWNERESVIMAVRISPLAHVDPRAELGDGIEVGPFCFIGPNVSLGGGCKLDSHVCLTGHATIGRNNRFFPHSVIGADPQDLGYKGAPTQVIIGDGNTFREGVTVHRGAEKEDHVTRIGNRCMFMTNSHVGHNCVVEDNVMIVSGALLGGHVHVHDAAIISGNSCVHQFVNIGTLAMVGGGSRVAADVPPYMIHVGCDQARVRTINLVGMQRRGIPASTIAVIKTAHRLLFRDCLGIIRVREHFAPLMESGEAPPELETLLSFIEISAGGKSGRGGEARRHSPSVPAPRPDADSSPIRRAA
jgi:UDP-N-acetylglucosamine acyltransferase